MGSTVVGRVKNRDAPARAGNADTVKTQFFGVCLSICLSVSRSALYQHCHFSSNIAFSYAHLLDMDCEI